MPRPTTIRRGPLRNLVEELGGVLAAAVLFRVDRRTLLRWGCGETVPSDEDQRRVNQIARRRGMREPF